MAVLGKVFGGTLGFFIGGPIGALAGVAFGHSIDRFRDSEKEILEQDGSASASIQPERASAVFAIAVIALAAKVAKADGSVTRDEILTFRKWFSFPPEDEERISALYNEARRSADGYEEYAAQVGQLFVDRKELLAELVDALYAIAAADGTLHPEEEKMIARIGAMFGLSAQEMRGLRARHTTPTSAPGSDLAKAYEALEVSPDASDEEIQKVHRNLVRKFHPDKLASQGLPEEFTSFANDRLAAINAANDAITKARGGR